ncbi:hypothetical protein [Dactylosporangium maewongense]
MTVDGLAAVNVAAYGAAPTLALTPPAAARHLGAAGAPLPAPRRG